MVRSSVERARSVLLRDWWALCFCRREWCWWLGPLGCVVSEESDDGAVSGGRSDDDGGERSGRVLVRSIFVGPDAVRYQSQGLKVGRRSAVPAVLQDPRTQKRTSVINTGRLKLSRVRKR